MNEPKSVRIPKELTMDLNDSYTSITNKVDVINFIKGVSKLDLLEYYLYTINLVISKDSRANIQDVQDIVAEVNNQINKIKGINTIEEKVEVVKEKVEKNAILSDFKIIDTEKETNDKINGVRKGVTYLQIKINNQLQLFEITNIDSLNNKLNSINNKSTKQEILYLLKDNIKQINFSNIDEKEEFNLSTLEDEINEITDSYLKKVLLENKHEVLIERNKILDFMRDSNKMDESVNYGVNSNGERIYTIGEETYRFVGDNERKLVKLEDSKSMENEETNDFENKDVGNNKDEYSFVNEYTKAVEMGYDSLEIFYENIENNNYLDNLLTDIENGRDVGSVNESIVIDFLNFCVLNESSYTINKYNSQLLFNKYYNYYLRVKDDLPNTLFYERFQEIMERHISILNRVDKSSEEYKDYELEKPYVKKLELPDEYNARGFISITVLLESLLVISFIISLILLVK
ncbi:MAG: hypothetical protein IJD92_02535 [Bacilli bacterium]|nr:hypothetical protein [Bacilli bacterium]